MNAYLKNLSLVAVAVGMAVSCSSGKKKQTAETIIPGDQSAYNVYAEDQRALEDRLEQFRNELQAPVGDLQNRISTLDKKIADLGKGGGTGKLEDGRTFGEALQATTRNVATVMDALPRLTEMAKAFEELNKTLDARIAKTVNARVEECLKQYQVASAPQQIAQLDRTLEQGLPRPTPASPVVVAPAAPRPIVTPNPAPAIQPPADFPSVDVPASNSDAEAGLMTDSEWDSKKAEIDALLGN